MKMKVIKLSQGEIRSEQLLEPFVVNQSDRHEVSILYPAKSTKT
jgi:hypothetical protein